MKSVEDFKKIPVIIGAIGVLMLNPMLDKYLIPGIMSIFFIFTNIQHNYAV